MSEAPPPVPTAHRDAPGLPGAASCPPSAFSRRSRCRRRARARPFRFPRVRQSPVCGRPFEVDARNQLPLERIFAHHAVVHEQIGVAFDQLLETFVSVEQPIHPVIEDQQRRRPNHPAGHAVVVADDRVLDCVRERKQHHQVERIELQRARACRRAAVRRRGTRRRSPVERFFRAEAPRARTCPATSGFASSNSRRILLSSPTLTKVL